MNARLSTAFALCLATLTASGCHAPTAPPPALPPGPHEMAAQANRVFLAQKPFDPWVLTYSNPALVINVPAPQQPLPLYIGMGSDGFLYTPLGQQTSAIKAGDYRGGQLYADVRPFTTSGRQLPPGTTATVTTTLNMHTGIALFSSTMGTGKVIATERTTAADWPTIWKTSDVKIDGDPEAQQVTHANLFYLLSSTYPGSRHSLPPMGLSSTVYGGHIFWDADVWMLPALIVQHPEYAKPIIDYRFDRLAQAKQNAKAHKFSGAEFPWESADTGKEEAPAEFAEERHITADVAWAAWQYYLWTGDKAFLQTEGWPLLQASADYWAGRVTAKPGGQFHILHTLGPDETAGSVDDDAYTVGVVRESLDAAVRCGRLLGRPVNPQWQTVHDGLRVPFDRQRGIPQTSQTPLTERYAGKQADALLLLHPLHATYDTATQGRMLDFYSAHTIKNGPAMTDSIHAIVAARLGRSQQSLDFFQGSYRPFERGPWDAFSEKRTTNNVYFLTGMAGCVQAVLYGFAGLNVAEAGHAGRGTKLTGDGECSLYASPHLPPGWNGLTVQGIRFRGKTLTLTVGAGNRVTVK